MNEERQHSAAQLRAKEGRAGAAVWTVAGYGAGGLILNPGTGAPIETGLSMAMAASGGGGQILGGGEGFGLAA